MARGDGLITFLPQNSEFVQNNGALPTNYLAGINRGDFAQAFDQVSRTNRLCMYYNDVRVTGPYIWYFMGIMPRQYSGNGILVNLNICFNNINTYLTNPFNINFILSVQRLDSLDAAVNIDIPTWPTAITTTLGFSTSLINFQTSVFSIYIPAANLQGIVGGDLFRFFIAVQNNVNTFPIYMYIPQVNLQEWT